MAIKKGIVVLDGTTEVHKLTDDGNVTISNNESGFNTGPTATLKGNVMVEGVTEDLVKTLNNLVTAVSSETTAREAQEEAVSIQTATWETNKDSEYTTRWGDIQSDLDDQEAAR